MTEVNTDNVADVVRRKFATASVAISEIELKVYPDETIIIVRVPASDFETAIRHAGSIDTELHDNGFRGFVAIRKSESPAKNSRDKDSASGVADPRAIEFANLCTGRSRTSEVQPSLTYIRNATNSLEQVLAARNHLVFGRRGAGKTALLVEAKQNLEKQGHITVWLNIQSVRTEGVMRSFLWAARGIIDALIIRLKDTPSRFVGELSSLSDEILTLLGRLTTKPAEAQRLVPRLQHVIKRSLSMLERRLFLFLDDLHYLPRADQPLLLDMLHGSFRDTNGWLKVTAIRHLARWFQSSPPLGLQSGDDAADIDLDFTLESPSEAKHFLDRVLDTFAGHAGLRNARTTFSEEALNRLVLASGAVPRDYLELAAASIKEGKKRSNARLVGVQDVNRAAGEQSKIKLQELEDDAAAAVEGGAPRLIAALNTVRSFCLDDKHYTFFRVDFQDKEKRAREYSMIAALLDVKIIHLVAPSLSDTHAAGRRGEVYMLDLSEFSGQRLKKNLWALDFVDGHLVLKKTNSTTPMKPGNTARKLQELLRRGPTFELEQLAQPTVGEAKTKASGKAPGKPKAASSKMAASRKPNKKREGAR